MNSRTCQSCGAEYSHESSCPACSNNATIAPGSNPNPLEPDPTGLKREDATLAPSNDPVAGAGGNKATGETGAKVFLDSQAKDFGNYVLLEELARGGMGIVYKARHKELNRIVAIKMIISGQYSSELDIQRFQLEAKAAAQLDHPGIVPIYEINSHQGQPYFAMKLVEGGSLSENHSRFENQPRKIAKFVARAARAVHHAHQRGILHRDIKPANILLDENEKPLLTDLGLAKLSSGESNLTQTGAVLGTPSYMPPEQAKSSSSLTMAVDIYALGAILYELLTGKPPHRGESALETVLQVLSDPIVPVREVDSQVDRDLALICMNCLHKDPEARYASASDLADDLESWIDGSPISVKPASFITRTTQWIKHNQGIVYIVMLLLGAMIFTVPLVFSILGFLDNAVGLYTDTEDDPLPLIYSFTTLPTWMSIVGVVGVLLLWPTIGILVARVTRPKNWWRATINGSVVAGIAALLMILLLGWVPFSIASQASSNETVRDLANSVWSQNEEGARSETQKRLVEKYPALKELPDNRKANFIGNRTLADGVAIGPYIAFGILVLAFLLSLPIVIGTTISQQLLSRGHRWWFFIPRYCVACLAAFMTFGAPFALFTGSGEVNNKPIQDTSIWFQIFWLCWPPLLTFLVLRRWKKPVSVVGKVDSSK